MKNLKRYFKGVDVGEKCTGTICFFRLNAEELLRERVVTKVTNKGLEDYYFRGLPEGAVADE